MTLPFTLLCLMPWEVTSHVGRSWEDLAGVWGANFHNEIKGREARLGGMGRLGGNLQGFTDYEWIVVPLNYLACKNQSLSHAKPCKLPPNLPKVTEVIEREDKKLGGKVLRSSLMGGNTSQLSRKSEEKAGFAAILLEIQTIEARKQEGGRA